jgi:NADPH-dependent 2,4-dienoyl-CoA reductase/sulfur reductase-like enzyme
MDDKTKFVGTIYDPNYAMKVKWMRENFKGGRALFAQPPAPIKCGGAPQKIAYLCDDYWKKKNIKADVHFFTPLPSMFAVKYFSDALVEIVKEKGITPHYTTVLQSVRDGVATFKNTSDNTIFEEKFDFLHAVPLMAAPKFLVGNIISNPSGFVTVDSSMRHKKYDNVWALGDCIDLPNAKTAAAVFSQAPVLVHNLEQVIKKTDGKLATYDGYSSCPIYLSKGELLLCEFKDYLDEKGNLVKELDESFHPGQQNKPRKLYYWITCMFTKIYSYSLKGKWYGKYSVVKPDFNNPSKTEKIRKYYKYIDYLPYLAVIGGGIVFLTLI